MHNIQRKLLERLAYSSGLAFSDLKPEGLPNNSFMYHLKQLQKDNLVAKTETEYHLTTEGQAYVDRLSFSSFRPRVQPKILTVLAIKNEQGETLLFRHEHQPFLDLVGYPSGKLHLEESVEAAAHRELQEKAGVGADLTQAGDAYIKIFDHDKLISHILGHVFVGQTSNQELESAHAKGEAFWGQASDYQGQLFPGFRELTEVIEDNDNFFFVELSEQL